jgi:hypothetical protein
MNQIKNIFQEGGDLIFQCSVLKISCFIAVLPESYFDESNQINYEKTIQEFLRFAEETGLDLSKHSVELISNIDDLRIMYRGSLANVIFWGPLAVVESEIVGDMCHISGEWGHIKMKSVCEYKDIEDGYGAITAENVRDMAIGMMYQNISQKYKNWSKFIIEQFGINIGSQDDIICDTFLDLSPDTPNFE